MGKAVRNATNALLLKAIWLDVDVKSPPKGYASIKEAVQAIAKFIKAAGLPPASALICSGNGVQCYWISDVPLTPEVWRPYAEGLKQAALAHGLLFDAGVTTDTARILRVPRTFNQKTDPAKPTSVLGLGKDVEFASQLSQLPVLSPKGPAAPAPTDTYGNFHLGPAEAFADLDPHSDRLSDGIRKPEGTSREEIRACLDVIPNDKPANWIFWNNTLMRVYAASDGEDYGLEEVERWSAKNPADGTGETCADRWGVLHTSPPTRTGAGALVQAGRAALGDPAWLPNRSTASAALFQTQLAPSIAAAGTVAPDTAAQCRNLPDGVSLTDFHAYMPNHNYIFVPSREPWPATSVNSRLGLVPLFGVDGKPILDANGNQKKISASAWLDQNKPVEQMTWAPGLPMVIRDRLIAEGGWLERHGVSCFNLYLPPTIKPGNATEAGPWLDHVHKIYPDDTDHILPWFTHRVQRPQEKINHALLLGGAQGIGKDTMLEPIKHAVGPWNFSEISPQQILGRFNGFLKSVVLRVNEARDLGDSNRFEFYDHMKAYTAAPPDVLRVDEKNLREHSVLNCCGVVITTNYKLDGIFLPADDRRHFVAWSRLGKEDFADDYWNRLWGWFANGGYEHVAAYLAELDISSFDSKAPPPKTPAFWDVVDANRAPEDGELADVLDKMQNPDAVTLNSITNLATGDFFQWITDRKNRRAIPHRLEKCDYVPVRNDAAKDGLWVINGARQVVYAKSELSIANRVKAASDLAH